MMVRPSAGVGYKGKLTNDNPALLVGFSIGTGSLTADRVPNKTLDPDKSATRAQLSDALWTAYKVRVRKVFRISYI